MSKYQDRFEDVISFIEGNLNNYGNGENDSLIDINRLCEVACLSKYHFHRQCSAFFGMPVMSLVKLLRLKRAAYQLAYRHEQKIIEIAINNGYKSHEAFSRVFKKHFNTTPSNFRKNPHWTPWYTQYQPVLKLREKIMETNKHYQIEVVNFPETLIATLEHKGPAQLLGTSIQAFIKWRKENSLPPSKSKTFNLVYDDPNITPPNDYRFDIACAITKNLQTNNSDIVKKVIPAGHCARIRHIGSDDAIGVAINMLYEWLENEDYEVRDFPLFFERVSFFPEVAESEMITDVYLPIE